MLQPWPRSVLLVTKSESSIPSWWITSSAGSTAAAAAVRTSAVAAQNSAAVHTGLRTRWPGIADPCHNLAAAAFAASVGAAFAAVGVAAASCPVPKTVCAASEVLFAALDQSVAADTLTTFVVAPTSSVRVREPSD